MAHLLDVYRDAQQGRSQTVLIEGEAGVGKSRLAAEFLRHVRVAGDLALVGRCADVEGGLPFGPLTEAFRALIARGSQHGASSDLAALAPILPELRPPDGSDGANSRTGLFQGMYCALAEIGSPLAVAIEDAHWSDRSTRDALKFLVDRFVDEPIVLVITIRSDEPDPDRGLQAWLGEMKRKATVSVVDLQRLDRSNTGEQIRAITGAPPFPEVLDAVYRRSQGNPFFTEELLAAGTDASPAALPSLADILLAKVASLDEDSRSLLRALAVAETDLSSDALVETVARDADQVAHALRAAVEAQLLIRHPDDRYGFRHALVRELLYEELTAHERRRYHCALARVLAEANQQPDASAAARIANHWWEAAEPDRARTAFISAGDAAEVALAYAEAAEYMTHAAELSQAADSNDPPEDVLLERAARAAVAAGDWARSAELLDRAIQSVDPSHRPDRVAHLLERLSWTTWWGEKDPGLALLERAQRLQPSEPPTALGARILRTYAYMLEETGCDPRRSAELNAKAVDVALRAGDPLEEGRARVQAATALGPEMAADMAPAFEGLELIKRHGTPQDFIDATVRIGDALVYVGDFETVVPLMRDAIEVAGDLQIYDWPMLLPVYTNCLFYLGKWNEVEELDFLWSQRRLPPVAQALRNVSNSFIHIGQGRFEEAGAALALASDWIHQGASVLLRGNLAVALATYRLWTGDLDRAASEVRSGLDLLQIHPNLPHAPELYLLGLQVEASRVSSRRAAEQGIGLAEAYIEGARRASREGQDRLAPIVLNWSEAEYARARGHSDTELWKKVAMGWQEVKVPWFEGWACWRQAEALLESRAVRSTVVDVLGRAHQLASNLEAAPLMAEIESLARRARLPLATGEEPATDGAQAKSPRTDPHALTERELEVLQLVCAGKTNREIAGELFISAKTASAHVSHILGKLGVSRRIEAANVAHAMGIDVPG